MGDIGLSLTRIAPETASPMRVKMFSLPVSTPSPKPIAMIEPHGICSPDAACGWRKASSNCCCCCIMSSCLENSKPAFMASLSNASLLTC